MTTIPKSNPLIVILATLFVVVMIGGGGAGCGKVEKELDSSEAGSLVGAAVKGVIAKADVVASVYADRQDSAPKCPSGTKTMRDTSPLRCRVDAGTTESDGTYSLSVTATVNPPILVEVAGGTFLSETTGLKVDGPAVETPLRAFSSSVPAPGTSQTIAVTALTDLAAAQVLEMDTVAPTATQVNRENLQIAALFGLPNIDIIATVPSNVSAPGSSNDTNDKKTYGLINAGFSQLAQNLDTDVLALLPEIAKDLRDGAIDGNQLASAIARFQADPALNLTGFSVDATTLNVIRAAGDALANILTLENNALVVRDDSSTETLSPSTVGGSVATFPDSSPLRADSVVISFTLVPLASTPRAFPQFIATPSFTIKAGKQQITATISGIAVTSIGGVVVLTKPADAVFTLSDLTDNIGTKVVLTSPVASTSIKIVGISTIEFSPNQFAADIKTVAAVAQVTVFDELGTIGSFSYEIMTMGLNVRMRVGTTTCILIDTACEGVNLLAGTVVTQ